MLRWIFCAALVVATAATASAQPAKPDLAEAAALYRAAEQAMAERRYDDAARDYGAAYEISKDAVLFFKIASALDKGGKCPVAVTYYRRYLREGKPSAEHQKLTNERITACESGKAAPKTEPKTEPKADDKPSAEAKPAETKPKADGDKPKADGDKPKNEADKAKPDAGKPPVAEKKEAASTGAGAAPAIPDGTAGGAGAESAPSGAVAATPAGAPATTESASEDEVTAEPTGEVAAIAAAQREAAEAAEAATAASEPTADTLALAAADATAPDDAETFPPPPLRRTAAWLSVGTGIAFVTIGAVLALSAESTEDDIADLYIVRLGDDPLTYSGSTKRRYDELVDRGDTYQTLAWASFGVAAAAAAAATYFFLTSPSSSGSGEVEPPKPIALRPLVSREGGGVGASWAF